VLCVIGIIILFVCLFSLERFSFFFSPNDFAKAEIRLNIFSMARDICPRGNTASYPLHDV
jgi:hypothetical protein